MPLRAKGLFTWGLVIGTAYVLYRRLRRRSKVNHAAETFPGELERLLNGTDDVYTLYGLKGSPYSCKLEAALRWYGFKYVYIPYNLRLRPKLQARAGTSQLPVLLTPENWALADSSMILELLDSRSTRPMYPPGPLGVLVRCVEEWLDEWVIRYAVHYRFNCPDDLRYSVDNMAEELLDGPGLHCLGALFRAYMASHGARAVRAYGVATETDRAVAEEELLLLLGKLEEQLAMTKFALGDCPCAVDTIMIGYLRAYLLDMPTVSTVTRCFPRVVEYGLRGDTTGYWDGCSGRLAAFPNSTPFASFVLGQLCCAYGKFIKGNAQGLKAGNKSFLISACGIDTTFRTRCYPERSRRMVQAHVRRVMATATFSEREQLGEWLRSCGLADIFGPPTDTEWGVWETIQP